MLVTLLATAAAQAGNVNWAHQAGTLQSNGSVTVKSLSGGSYAGTQNPTGAVAKSNQNAATQSPTVIIQATSSGIPFNYKDDCYIIMPPTGAGYTQETLPRLGAGKIDATTGKFIGLLTFFGPGSGYPSASANALLAALLGGSYSGSYNVGTCGADSSCAYSAASYSSGNTLVHVSSLTVKSYSKCYP